MSAFFAFVFLLFVLSPLAANAAQSQPCALANNEKADETVTVSRVYDGDTVKLKDGRKIRVIGINTPEMDSSHHAREPFAQEATNFLRELIKKSNTIQIRYGRQKKDHYGRILAHIFLHDKQNLSALMLQKGLARSLHVPPNDWRFRCYDRLDRRAQRLKKGLWSNDYYQTINVNALKPTTSYKAQFLQISGIVNRIGDSEKNIWINLGSQFALRINKKFEHNFNGVNFNKLIGKKVTARGYVIYYSKQKQFRMLVRHPIAMVLPD